MHWNWGRTEFGLEFPPGSVDRIYFLFGFFTFLIFLFFPYSYSALMELVDHMFPPVSSSKGVDLAHSDYTAFSFWRTPVSDLPDLVENPNDFEFP